MLTPNEIKSLKKIARKSKCVVVLKVELVDKLEIYFSEYKLPKDYSKVERSDNGLYLICNEDGNIENLFTGKVDQLIFTVGKDFNSFILVTQLSKKLCRHRELTKLLLSSTYRFIKQMDTTKFTTKELLNKESMELELKDCIESLGITLV